MSAVIWPFLCLWFWKKYFFLVHKLMLPQWSTPSDQFLVSCCCGCPVAAATRWVGSKLLQTLISWDYFIFKNKKANDGKCKRYVWIHVGVNLYYKTATSPQRPTLCLNGRFFLSLPPTVHTLFSFKISATSTQRPQNFVPRWKLYICKYSPFNILVSRDISF